MTYVVLVPDINNCFKLCQLITLLIETNLKGKMTSHELWHDKTNKVTVHPAKTQISLGIRPVWSESSLGAQWVAKDPSFLHVDSEDWSDWADAQADLSLRWAHSHFVGFVMSQLTWWDKMKSVTIYMSLITRKSVFGVCNQVRHKPACVATEAM